MVGVQHCRKALDGLTVPRLLQGDVQRQLRHWQPQAIQLLRLARYLCTLLYASVQAGQLAALHIML